MGLDARKPDFGACEQQRRGPVFVSTQSGQRLYCSIVGKYIISKIATCKISFLAGLCS